MSDEDRYEEDFDDYETKRSTTDESKLQDQLDNLEISEGTQLQRKTAEQEEEDEEEEEEDGAPPPRRRRKKLKRRRKKKKKKKPSSRDSSRYDDEPEGFHDSQEYPEYMDGEGDQQGSEYGSEYGYGDEQEDTMDRYVATRRESARIMSKRFMERNEVKAKIMRDREKVQKRLQRSKKKKEDQWRRKMERSPFMVDLIAENERIDEENKVRTEEDTRRERMLHRRKEKIKNEIVLKALSEVSDLDALRREKRLIADEEKRLKALLIMEKANAHTKADLMAAQRAERQRKQVQAQYRRARLREETQRRRELETELLREKLAAPPDEAFTYFSRTLCSRNEE